VLGNPERPVGGLAVRVPPGVELRPLGREDREVAVRLARESRGLDGKTAAPTERYERLINDPDAVAFLALAGGEPVGLAIMELRRRLNFATFEGWISHLHVVEAAAGGEAIRDALLAALVAEWRLRGGHRILASVPDGPVTLTDSLRAIGFEEAFLDFRLRPVAVPQPGSGAGATIREVADEDAEAVTRLIAEFGSRRSPVPDRMEAVLRSYTAHVRAVRGGEAGSLVADLEGVTVGVCSLVWQRPFWTDELLAWIPDLVVTEPVRGRGIGRALLAEALRRAAEAGAAEVRLESGERRVAAQALYRSCGFVQGGRTWVLQRSDG
jgi:ribosomal protein S18 acetylase RimI-like enzyme